jgi:hypothetical protein
VDIVEQPGTKTERLPDGQSQVVVTAGRVVLEIPTAVLPRDDVLEVATIAPAAAPGRLPGEVVGPLIALTLASGQEIFQRPITLRLPYADSDHDGMVDGTIPVIDETALTRWFFEAITATWVRVQEALVLPEANVVTAPLGEVTVVGLFRADDESQGQLGLDEDAHPVRSGNGDSRVTGWQTISMTATAPFGVAWNTTRLANGPYALRAVCAATPAALTVPTPPSGDGQR